MSLTQLLLILRARAGLVFVIAATLLGLAAAVALSLPKRYQAEASVLVDPMSAALSGDGGGGWARENPAATQADVIASYGVALDVVKALDLTRRTDAIRLIAGSGPLHWLHVFVAELLPGSPGGRQASMKDWLATQLLDKLHVHTSSDSRVVKVAYSSPDAGFAAQVANAFVQAYLRSAAQVGTAPAERTAQLFDRQLPLLQQRLQQAEDRLSAFERKTGLVSAGQGLDAENARLADLSSQLVQAQSLDYVARAKQRRLQRFIRGGVPESEAPTEVLDSPAVQQSQQQVVQAQADLSTLSHRLGPNHPLYRAAETKLQRAQSDYRQQMLAVARGLLGSARNSAEQVAQLRAAERQQRSKVLGLKNAYAQRDVLQSDVDNARQAYQDAAQRLAKTRMQGEAAQNASATLLDSATPPLRPAGPKVGLILGIALLAGMALGIGAALWQETLDRRVRAPLDIVELIGLPVVAVLQGRARARRAPLLLGAPSRVPRLIR